MKEGDVVLTAFEQADGRTKNRPAIVLRVMRPFGDLLICGISRQLRHRVADFDEIIAPTDADFASSGLADTSLIRLGFLALLPAAEFLGDIGSIAPERDSRLLHRLATTSKSLLVNDKPPQRRRPALGKPRAFFRCRRSDGWLLAARGGAGVACAA